MAFATSSLPVPLSPTIKTLASPAAMRETSAATRVMAGLLPIRFGSSVRVGALSQPSELRTQAPLAASAFEHDRERVKRQGLGREIVGAGPDGSDRAIHASERRHDHDRHFGMAGGELRAELEAARCPWRSDVGEHHVEIATLQRSERFGGARVPGDVEALILQTLG